MIIREQHGTQNGQNCTQNLDSNNGCYKYIFLHTFCHGHSSRKSDYSKTHHLLLFVIVIIWLHHVWKNASIQLCFFKLQIFPIAIICILNMCPFIYGHSNSFSFSSSSLYFYSILSSSFFFFLVSASISSIILTNRTDSCVYE